MKTILFSVLLQTIVAISFFTGIMIMTTGLIEYQIYYFAVSMLSIIMPLFLFDIIGFAIVLLTLSKIKKANSVKGVCLLFALYALIISMVMVFLDSSPNGEFMGWEVSNAEYFLIQFFFFLVMALILAFFFIKYHRHDWEND